MSMVVCEWWNRTFVIWLWRRGSIATKRHQSLAGERCRNRKGRFHSRCCCFASFSDVLVLYRTPPICVTRRPIWKPTYIVPHINSASRTFTHIMCWSTMQYVQRTSLLSMQRLSLFLRTRYPHWFRRKSEIWLPDVFWWKTILKFYYLSVRSCNTLRMFLSLSSLWTRALVLQSTRSRSHLKSPKLAWILNWLVRRCWWRLTGALLASVGECSGLQCAISWFM